MLPTKPNTQPTNMNSEEPIMKMSTQVAPIKLSDVSASASNAQQTEFQVQPTGPCVRSVAPANTITTPRPQPQHQQPRKYAIANIKYKNDDGRSAILQRSLEVHHDFSELTSIINVTLTRQDLDDLSDDPNICWVDRNGAVHFVQPWKSCS